MAINISIEKRHLYLLSAILIFLAGISVVIALNSGDYQVHGHTADEIESLFEGICIYERSPSYGGDAIHYCPEEYPKLLSCHIADDQAPATGPSYPGQINNDCDSNGECKANSGDNTRGNLGTNNMYLEVVENSDNIQGCWQYDSGHVHNDYRIELVCCR